MILSRKVKGMCNLIKTIKTFKGKVCVFDVDDVSDLDSLPNSKTKPEAVQGSIANVINEGISYVLNSDDEWIAANRFINYPEA